MDPVIVDTILQTQRLAYVITEPDFSISAVRGTEFLPSPPLRQLAPGASLLDALPELAAAAAEIHAMLAGSLRQLELPLITRPHDDGGAASMSLCISLYHSPAAATQLLVQLADVTNHGRLHAQATERHAEIHKLSGELADRHIALQVANSELRRIDQVQTNFVTVAAHELRNPLTPILGYLELLLDDECGPLTLEQRTTLDVMLNNVLRLRTITSDLLDLAQIEAGMIELALHPTDLRTLVEMVCQQYRPCIAAQRLDLDMQLDDVPQAWCDEPRAAQLIGYVINNACKYTPPNGKLSVRLSRHDEGLVMLAVQNSGGISTGDLPYLFDAFFRTRAAAITSNGTGLGLHLTRLLIELHGGEIWFQPAADGGESTFCLTFLACDTLEDTPGARAGGAALPEAPALTARQNQYHPAPQPRAV